MTHPALQSGRTAIITGAASGIGRAAARALASRGMAVALIDLPGDTLQDATAEVLALGAQALALPADVSDRPALQAAADRIAATLPPVTLVMNNAGRGEPSACLGDPGPSSGPSPPTSGASSTAPRSLPRWSCRTDRPGRSSTPAPSRASPPRPATRPTTSRKPG